jgi:hypothetical protein
MKNIKTFESFIANSEQVNEAKSTIEISFRFNDSDDAETFCDAYGIKHRGSNYVKGEVDIKLIADMVQDLTEVYGVKNFSAE